MCSPRRKERRFKKNEISLEGISSSVEELRLREAVGVDLPKGGEAWEGLRKRRGGSGRGNFRRELKAEAVGLQVGAQR